MERHFSPNRLRKFVKNLLISITTISVFVAIFSQVYSGIYKIYGEKVKYCDEKYKDKYMYVIRDCYNPEQKIYRVWLDIQSESPKYTVAIIFIDLVAFGLYKYLFPESKKDIPN